MSQEKVNKELLKYAKEGNLEKFKLLISNDVDIYANNNYLLRFTVIHGNLEIIKYLVEQKLDIHAQDDFIFKIASYNGHLEVVKFFLFDCKMKIKQETKNWLIENHQHQTLKLIEKRNLLLKLNKDIIQKDSIDNLNKKVKI